MPAEHPPPLVLALVLADNGHVDPTSNKCFVLGTIGVLRFASFPAQLRKLCIYAALTEGRGKTDLTIRLVDADEPGEPIFSRNVEVGFETPLAVVELMYVRADLEIPEPGEYRLQLCAAGNPLCERRLIVAEIAGENRGP